MHRSSQEWRWTEMYRTVDCATWDDPWFAELTPPAKLLFLYFLTNRRSTAAGCFEVTMRQISFESGMASEEVVRHLGALDGRVTWFPEHQVVFVRNFYRRQSANSNKENFRASALKVLAEMPAEVRATVGDVYPELRTEEPTHTQPIPNPSPTQGDKEEVEVEEEGTVAAEGDVATARGRARTPKTPSGFEQFWECYPRKTGKADAEKAFVKLDPPPELLAQLIAAIERQNTWQPWLDGFVPHPATWLNGQRWLDEEPPRRSSANGRASPAAETSSERTMRNAEEAKVLLRQMQDGPDGIVIETTGAVR